MCAARMQPEYQPSKAAIFQFWGGMFGLAVFWIVMFAFQISKLQYLILTIMALFFVGMNVLGYYRCRTWTLQEVKAGQSAMQQGFGNVVSGLTSGMAQNFMVRASCVYTCILTLRPHCVLSCGLGLVRASWPGTALLPFCAIIATQLQLDFH
jgi:Eukaryotic protein of unknown function (DUF846)